MLHQGISSKDFINLRRHGESQGDFFSVVSIATNLTGVLGGFVL